MKRLLLLALAIPACSTTGPLPGPPAPTGKRLYLTGTPEWRTAADASRMFGSSVSVTGNTVDLKGNTLDGSRLKHPSNSNSEDSVPLTIRAPGLTLRNGTVSDIPGGIVIKTYQVRARNLVFIRPGEDFLSTVGAGSSGLDVYGCEFHNNRDGDKSVQINCAVDARVAKSTIIGGITGARIQESSYPNKSVRSYFTDTKFVGNETGLNVAGDTTVTLSGCTFDCRQDWVLSGSKARVVVK